MLLLRLLGGPAAHPRGAGPAPAAAAPGRRGRSGGRLELRPGARPRAPRRAGGSRRRCSGCSRRPSRPAACSAGSATWPCSACSATGSRSAGPAARRGSPWPSPRSGKRSLSCYLAQSVICAPLLAAWGLGLGGVFGSAQVALFAIGVWLLTVVLAYAQERAGQRGPAEVLLRRLVYRARARPPPRASIRLVRRGASGCAAAASERRAGAGRPARSAAPGCTGRCRLPAWSDLDGQQQQRPPGCAAGPRQASGHRHRRVHRRRVQVGQQHAVQPVAGHLGVAGVRAAAGEHGAERPRPPRAGPGT